MHPSRLYFAPKVSRVEYFKRLACVDLFLDSRPYAAHTVAADALWMQTPVMTLPGAPMASRVPQSLYRAAKFDKSVETTESNTCSSEENPCGQNETSLYHTAQRQAAIGLESLLVAYDRRDYIDTSVRLCQTRQMIKSELVQQGIPLLGILRQWIQLSMSPYISSRTATESEEIQPLKSALFNPQAFATDLSHAFAAMKEVKVQYDKKGSLLGTSNTFKALPHIFMTA